jgi:hypothetical protein
MPELVDLITWEVLLFPSILFAIPAIELLTGQIRSGRVGLRFCRAGPFAALGGTRSATITAAVAAGKARDTGRRTLSSPGSTEP